MTSAISSVSFRTRRPSRHHGFTLVELLVVIAIVAALAVLSSTVASHCRKRASAVREIAGAKNLGSALALSSADNNGRIIKGFDGTMGTYEVEKRSGFSDSVVQGSTAHRYPWRLAPYFDYSFKTTTVLDKSLNHVLDHKDPYLISLLPSLGMNVYGVGGVIEEGARPGTEVNPDAVKSMISAHSPERLIAFVSTRSSDSRLNNKMAPGFHMATPRLMPGGSWAASYSETNAASWGNVDLRHDGKAAVSYLDGSAGLLDKDGIRDMRNWCNQAAIENDPNYRMQRAGGGRR